MNKHSELMTKAGPGGAPQAISAQPRPAALMREPQGFVLTLPQGGLDGPGLDGPIFDSGTETFRVRRFARNIRRVLDGNCVGYGYAINQGGQRVGSGGGGARQLANNPASNLPMSARRRMHTASVTKTLTAVCVLKALRDMGLTPTARVRDYLPSQWNLNTILSDLTMADLLTHRSGFDTSGTDPHYGTLRDAIENATGWTASIPSNPYDNRNFALFRVILPYIVCPQIMANVEAQAWSDGNYDAAVDQATQENYKILMRHYVFNPLGMRNVDCRPNPNNAGRTMCYMWPNPSPAQAQDGGDKTDEAGSEGWVLSARQLAKFLRFRRYSNAFLHPSLRSLMDSERYGWRQVTGEHGTYLQHGGAYGAFSDPDGDGSGVCVPGSGPVRTCILQFPINVEVAVTVNSFVNGCSGPNTNLTRLVADAFDDAFV